MPHWISYSPVLAALQPLQAVGLIALVASISSTTTETGPRGLFFNLKFASTLLIHIHEIEVSDLQLPVIQASEEESQTSLGEMTRSLEKDQIASALEDNRWNQSATARALGLTLRQLRYRIEKLNLNP